jgi:hypothetical protein
VRKKVARLAVHIGEVAAPAAGHQDLLAGLVGVIQQQHPAAAPGGGQRAHQTGRAGTDNHNLRSKHSVFL